MRVVDCIPREASDPSFILMRDEHGRCLLDEMPLRFEVMLNGTRYLKKYKRHYSHVQTNEHSLLQICTTSAPFSVETHEVEPVASVDPDEWGSDQEVLGGAEMEQRLDVHYIESDEEEEIIDTRRHGHRTVSETTPRKVFIIDSADEKPLRQIAAEAFLGMNYPTVGEPGHDPLHGSSPDKRAFTTLYSNEGL